MRELIEIGLAFIDLMKAELELSKRVVFNLGIALGLVMAASVVLVCAIGLMLYAAYLGLLSVFAEQKWAVFFTGLGALGCAGALIWIASYKGRHYP
jgi:hypothetical protein